MVARIPLTKVPTCTCNYDMGASSSHKYASDATALCIGQSVQRSGEPITAERFILLRPGYSLVKRQRLSNKYLDAEYSIFRAKLLERIRQETMITIAVDGWSDARNRSIFGVLVMYPRNCEVVSNVRHTGEFVRDLLIDTVEPGESDFRDFG